MKHTSGSGVRLSFISYMEWTPEDEEQYTRVRRTDPPTDRVWEPALWQRVARHHHRLATQQPRHAAPRKQNTGCRLGQSVLEYFFLIYAPRPGTGSDDDFIILHRSSGRSTGPSPMMIFRAGESASTSLPERKG
jgi:hypothetical protein